MTSLIDFPNSLTVSHRSSFLNETLSHSARHSLEWARVRLRPETETRANGTEQVSA
jgi:hypothetical protein